jgi:hypothetical protein
LVGDPSPDPVLFGRSPLSVAAMWQGLRLPDN